MAILLDQNISYRLLGRIAHEFPDAAHVRLLGLTDYHDFQIYMHARREGFEAVLTLDEDFSLLQLEHGTPPKVIWLRTGNCSTSELANIVNINASLIHAFLDDAEHDCLELYR